MLPFIPKGEETMRKFEYVVLIEENEDGMLVASCPGLRGCHTQAKTMPELFARIKEAMKLCLKVEKSTPKPLRFVGLQEVKVAC